MRILTFDMDEKWKILITLYVMCCLTVFMYVSHNFKVQSAQNIIETNYQLNENSSTKDIFLFMENPPATCHNLVSLGGKKMWNKVKNITLLDGEKIICDNPGPLIPFGNCLVYSFGSNYDFSFEKAVKKRYNCEVYTFDPRVKLSKLKKINHKDIIFFQIGLAAEDKIIKKWHSKYEMRSLKSIKKTLGHNDKVLNILKIDIEGDEWAVLQSLIDTKELQMVDHLNIEIHIKSFSDLKSIYPKLLRMGFRLFSYRPNESVDPVFIRKFGALKHLVAEIAFYKPSSL